MLKSNSKVKLDFNSSLFSDVQEWAMHFLPSFRMDRENFSYKVKDENDFMSYTDRIFSVVKFANENPADNSTARIDQRSYLSDLMDFSADHAFVYGSYDLVADFSSNALPREKMPKKGLDALNKEDRCEILTSVPNMKKVKNIDLSKYVSEIKNQILDRSMI